MHSSAMGWFSRTSIVVAVVMIAGGARLTAQTADSVPHVRPHGMAWGRETFVLSEVLDYSPAVAARSLDYDVVAWSGGAVNRLWLKVDGGIATRGQAMHGEYQVLYGRLVSPWWDAQFGARVDQQSSNGRSASRVGAVLGLQGLAPGWFELEPSLFVTTDGNVSFDMTASYDLFLTQRFVLQPRIESTVALRDEADFGVGRGLSSTSFGLRTRFEIRREVAPYVGVVWDRSYGRTKELANLSGDATSEARVVAGLRLWW